MKRRSCVLLLVAAALSFVLPVAPVAAQTTTTDTENQSGATLVLRGQGFIQQLIGQYGASAKVVDVARSLLSQLGAQYQRALLDADLRVVAIEIAKIDKQRQDLADLLPLIDEEIANLDPASPTYAADLASLNASRSSTVASIAQIDTVQRPPLVAQQSALNAAVALLPSAVSPFMQQNLADWVGALAKISPASQAATLGDFASAAGILIDDGHVVPVAGNWGAGFAGSQAVGGNAFLYATNSGQLTDEGKLRTPNRDYSYKTGGGLVTVNVQVTTHYYGFMAITAAAEPAAAPANIPALGPLALWLLAALTAGAGALVLRRKPGSEP